MLFSRPKDGTWHTVSLPIIKGHLPLDLARIIADLANDIGCGSYIRCHRQDIHVHQCGGRYGECKECSDIAPSHTRNCMYRGLDDIASYSYVNGSGRQVILNRVDQGDHLRIAYTPPVEEERREWP